MSLAADFKGGSSDTSATPVVVMALVVIAWSGFLWHLSTQVGADVERVVQLFAGCSGGLSIAVLCSVAVRAAGFFRFLVWIFAVASLVLFGAVVFAGMQEYHAPPKVVEQATPEPPVTVIVPPAAKGTTGTPSKPTPPPAPPLEPPVRFMARAGNGFVELSWIGSTGAESYTLSRRIGKERYKLLQSHIVGTSFRDQTVENGVTYDYALHAVSGKRRSKSVYTQATPRAPLRDGRVLGREGVSPKGLYARATALAHARSARPG